MSNYINRRIEATSNFVKQEYSDEQFFDLARDNPLIILGEPGAGKTELLEFAAKKFNSKRRSASALLSSNSPSDEQNIPIIDGIDEITAYANNAPPINQILNKIPKNQYFILSCRAADWQNALNENIITENWKKKAVVGTIMPFAEYEIIEFINKNGSGQDGYKFFTEAKRRDMSGLLINPQNLSLFLTVVAANGWPNSRMTLYKDATQILAKENNKLHRSINQQGSAPEKLLEAAGFIFAQLLLSGNSGVHREDRDVNSYPHLTNFSTDDYTSNLIKETLSTNLFRAAGVNCLEPCHRTVAEFLAAQWLAKALNKQSDVSKLSCTRLETILYDDNYFVPSALRGLHAWLVTLCATLPAEFIKRDPYGLYRYGDPNNLSDLQAEYLLDGLIELTERDPYFRANDWQAFVAKGIARNSLRNEIVTIIQKHETHGHLAVFLLDAMKGDEFVDSITDELLELVRDNNQSPSMREVIVQTLADSQQTLDWNNIVATFYQTGDDDSLYVALRIIYSQAKLFSSAEIAKILIQFMTIKHTHQEARYFKIPYGFENKLSPIQLEEVMEALLKNYPLKRNMPEELRIIFLDFLYGLLQHQPLPSADKIWRWLEYFDTIPVIGTNWNYYSKKFFNQNSEYRQTIQAEAIKVTDAKNLWIATASMVQRHGAATK